MKSVVTPTEMRAIDAEAPEEVEELIERAGWAVARAALDLLGTGYGARVLVIAGKGNNGADGRSAAVYLQRRGVRCTVVTPAESLDPRVIGPEPERRYDLVIDAAYGTGFRGTNRAPSVGSVPVLAVDIPSGVDGSTGQVGGEALSAVATVTFAALKPGLLFQPGASLAGTISVADIGLDCSRARCRHLQLDDLSRLWPKPDVTTHKWRRAVWVIGGSPGLLGAPGLAASAAGRGGAGYVAVSIPPSGLTDRAGEPGSLDGSGLPIEAVRRPLSANWADDVLAGAHRFGALVVGPGLAVDAASGRQVRSLVSGLGQTPMVLDGGAIDALIGEPQLLRQREVPAVLTPHDGEFARLTGAAPGDDRIEASRATAAAFGAVVVLKGPTTVIAEPDGEVLVSTAGDARLASAGTGDVLAGLIGAALTGGIDPFTAAGLGAELHGRAALGGWERGFVASDLPPLVANLLDSL